MMSSNIKVQKSEPKVLTMDKAKVRRPPMYLIRAKRKEREAKGKVKGRREETFYRRRMMQKMARPCESEAY